MKEKLISTNFEWILLGFTFHALGSIFFFSSKPACYLLCGLGLLLIFINLFKMDVSQPLTGFAKTAFYFYIVWSTFIIIRPFLNGETFSMDGFSLINRYTFLSLLTPLIVFISLKNISLKSVWKFCLLHGLIGLVLLVVNYKKIFGVDQSYLDDDAYQAYINVIDIPLQFMSISGFMMLCYFFVSKKYLIASFSAMTLSVFTVMYTARRGTVFMYLIMFIFALYLYIFSAKDGSKSIRLAVTSIFIILFVVLFLQFGNSTFSLLLSRLEEDTRSGVEASFYRSFQGKTSDWIVGRGINGTYFCDVFAIASYRGEIETGYLHIILKGGFIYLITFVLFLSHAAYLGFFKSQNMLTKAMALYLVAHIIYLVPYGLPAFNFEYIILWICVFYCHFSRLRALTDKQLLHIFQLKST